MTYKDLLTKKELSLIDEMIDITINDTNDTIDLSEISRKISMYNKYVKAYNIYAECWDDINDEAKNRIIEKLKRVNL